MLSSSITLCDGIFTITATVSRKETMVCKLKTSQNPVVGFLDGLVAVILRKYSGPDKSCSDPVKRFLHS